MSSPSQGQPPNPQPNLPSLGVTACQLCTETIHENSVSCARCDKSFHENCVSTSSKNGQASFQCQTCTEPPRSTRSRGSRSSQVSIVSITSQSRRIALELQKLEDERAIEKEFIAKKYKLLDQQIEDEDNCSRNSRSRSVREWLDKQPQENQTLENITQVEAVPPPCYNSTAFAPMTATSIQNKNTDFQAVHSDGVMNLFKPPTNTQQPLVLATSTNIVEFAADLDRHISLDNVPSRERISNAAPNVPTSQAVGTNTSRSFAFQQPMPHERIVQQLQAECTVNAAQLDSHRVLSNKNCTAASAQVNSESRHNQQKTNFQHQTINQDSFGNTFEIANQTDRSLTSLQINARQSVPKELPLFSGHPEEWPLFSSTFEWSTNVCGLTNAENLVRLQRSLRGEALRSVQHILIHPSCVQAAMSTLRLLFGQPEKILYSIKNRIKSTPSINANKLETITEFAVSVKGLQATIEACGLIDELNNSCLLQELVEKLTPALQLNWGSHKLNLSKLNWKPNLAEFSNWIMDAGLAASSIVASNRMSETENSSRNRSTKKAFVHSHSEDTKMNCLVCKRMCNNIANCDQFKRANRGERWDIVRKYRLCRQCLCPHYGQCKYKTVCGVDNCQYKHHPLLHLYDKNEQQRVAQTSKTADQMQIKEKVQTSSCNAHSAKKVNIFFKIIPVKLFGENNTAMETYAFIDEGSSITLMDESLARQLGVEGKRQELCLTWTGGHQRMENSSQRLTIQIAGANKRKFSLDVHTVSDLMLPKQTLNYSELSQQYQHLRNLPIQSYTDATPRLLIGVNNWNLGIPNEVREGSPYQPVAVRTRLGWHIYGSIKTESPIRKSYSFHTCECSHESELELNDLVKQFYNLDHIGISSTKLPQSKDDELALQILDKYTKKIGSHYETALLWRSPKPNVPNSFEMAKRRLICLERKLVREPVLLQKFEQTISSYLAKGYIRKIPATEAYQENNNNLVWYLPTFAVGNKNKPGKTRIVWDAAAKSQGVSLNSLLLKGPDLLSSLAAILFHFRQRAVAVCGDIEEMFHQIFIRAEDQDAQRFLWRSCDEEKEPEIYAMNVMIFGASCAPSTSQFVKNLNASLYEKDYPAAARAIKENHYVDDYLDSVDTVEQAIKMVSDVKYIHKQGGFNIRNWVSNRADVFSSLSGEQVSTVKNISLSGDSSFEKVLGIFWVSCKDVITFKISPLLSQSDVICGKRPPTKREMLRIIMSVYDPLGLIANFLMYAKILMQEVWRSAVEWDEVIRPAQVEKWTTWLNLLPNLTKIEIPRCYLQHFSNYDHIKVQLHTFVDASENGYAAVCFFRIFDGGSVVCSLVGARTRVAPLKITSIPRLELMAALIGARFSKYVCENHTIKIREKVYWTDSKTVLSWLRADHRRYQQFVAFRVSEIQDTTELNAWRWVPSKLNVADEATKWTKSPTLTAESRWFSGPSFLYLTESKWPQEPDIAPPSEELRHNVLNITTTAQLIDMHRFSKWKRAVRAVAYVIRFVHNYKSRMDKTYGELTQTEIRQAENVIYRQAQKESFANEIKCLEAGTKISKSSPLYKLSAYLDEDDILRVEGRIDEACVVQDVKRPIILPRKSYTTFLIIMDCHTTLHHINHETAVNELRQKFYISRMRSTLKSHVRNCQMCKIQKARPEPPQMAKLPRARLSAYVNPFTFTGLDFFGPIVVSVNRHKEKRYGALFTCLTVRAVHVEMVYTLTTSSCILAIRKFIARRGTPREFYSDNATNFVGAERELREAVHNVDTNQFVRSFTSATTKWNFIPPASPHMGGAWERLVRSIKTVLYKIAPSRSPSDELLQSMMAEAENIVNSRPLTYVPIDDSTSEALTPNHILLGCSNGMKPIASFSDSEMLLKHSWLCSQQYADHFWKRWVAEYLPTLTCRTKYFEKSKPLRVGDLVVVVDPASPRNVWPRGKVIETRLAKDGQVRSAKILTAHGILERPTMKIAILDVDRE